MKIIGTERDYQRYIIDYLIENNGYIERKCKTDYARTTAMDRELLFRFLNTTQPDTMSALRKIYNGQTEETIVKFIIQSIDNKGSSLIETLKSGIEISNMHLACCMASPPLITTSTLLPSTMPTFSPSWRKSGLTMTSASTLLCSSMVLPLRPLS